MTTTSPFSAPAAPSAGVDWQDLDGALLLIEPHSFETAIKTTFGDKDAVRADVVVLDGDKAGEQFNDTLIFPLVLLGQLRQQIGQKVLGRLGTGNAKPGQKPPWKLNEATAADVEIGTAWLNKQQAAGLAAPAAAGAATDEVPF